MHRSWKAKYSISLSTDFFRSRRSSQRGEKERVRSKFILCILALCVSSAIASAASFRVLGGEHDGFTRIVIYTSASLEWNLVSNDRVVEITFPGHQDGFLTETIFNRIARRRVLGIDSTENTLRLSLGCSCTVSYTHLTLPTILLV